LLIPGIKSSSADADKPAQRV